MNEIIDKIEMWLDKPVEDGIDQGVLYADTLLKEIEAELDNNFESKKYLGPLIGKIKRLQKTLHNLEKVDWVEVLGGHLAIGHRPSNKMFGDLNIQGATHVVTLLCEREGAANLEKAAKKQNFAWFWFPMESASPPDVSTFPVLKNLFLNMTEALNSNGKVYLHCSAGIHRTGMITYAFLRFAGMDKASALEKLMLLRSETGKNVGVARIEWGDSFAQGKEV
ncbi:MAG: hypothetical protein CMF14_09200 [Idiomarina sp.]|nr:hypothetical protein [Idiomarina sp.]